MRVGDEVLYVPAPGAATGARVVDVLGAGTSGYKVLSLVTATGRVVPTAPHVRDCAAESGYWCQHAEEIKPRLTPERRARITLPTDET